MRDFVYVWMVGYVNPRRAFAELRNKPAPQWGLYATLIRSAGIVLFSYVPAVMAQNPVLPPSYITLLPTEDYFSILLVLAPLVHFYTWLMGSALTHLVVRLTRRASSLDTLLNLHGLAALMVWVVLQLYDWGAIWFGFRDAMFLGMSHALIDLTLFMGLVVTGYRQMLDLPARLGVGLVLLQLAAGIPIAALFLRMP